MHLRNIWNSAHLRSYFMATENSNLWQLKIATYHNNQHVIFYKYLQTVRLLGKLLTLFL